MMKPSRLQGQIACSCGAMATTSQRVSMCDICGLPYNDEPERICDRCAHNWVHFECAMRDSA